MSPPPSRPDRVGPTSARVGVVGGGQLARMMAQAAIPLSVACRVFSDDGDESTAALLPHHPLPYDTTTRDALRDLTLTSRGYEIETEMLIKLRRRGARVTSVPVTAVYASERSRLRPVRDTTKTCFLAVYYQFLERL